MHSQIIFKFNLTKLNFSTLFVISPVNLKQSVLLPNLVSLHFRFPFKFLYFFLTNKTAFYFNYLFSVTNTLLTGRLSKHAVSYIQAGNLVWKSTILFVYYYYSSCSSLYSTPFLYFNPLFNVYLPFQFAINQSISQSINSDLFIPVLSLP